MSNTAVCSLANTALTPDRLSNCTWARGALDTLSVLEDLGIEMADTPDSHNYIWDKTTRGFGAAALQQEAARELA